jgi:hypothetical protein
MGSSSGLSAGVVVACLCAAPACADTIYTCAGRSGAPVLQNMPCDTDSEVSVQQDMREARSATPVPGGAQAAGASSSSAGVSDRQAAQSAVSDVSGAATDAAAPGSDELANLPSEPAVGMSQQQVRAILGEPTAITQEEVVQGREVTWTYGDRVLQFDTTGRLSKK